MSDQRLVVWGKEFDPNSVLFLENVVDGKRVNAVQAARWILEPTIMLSDLEAAIEALLELYELTESTNKKLKKLVYRIKPTDSGLDCWIKANGINLVGDTLRLVNSYRPDIPFHASFSCNVYSSRLEDPVLFTENVEAFKRQLELLRTYFQMVNLLTNPTELPGAELRLTKVSPVLGGSVKTLRDDDLDVSDSEEVSNVEVLSSMECAFGWVEALNAIAVINEASEDSATETTFRLLQVLCSQFQRHSPVLKKNKQKILRAGALASTPMQVFDVGSFRSSVLFAESLTWAFISGALIVIDVVEFLTVGLGSQKFELPTLTIEMVRNNLPRINERVLPVFKAIRGTSRVHELRELIDVEISCLRYDANVRLKSSVEGTPQIPDTTPMESLFWGIQVNDVERIMKRTINGVVAVAEFSNVRTSDPWLFAKRLIEGAGRPVEFAKVFPDQRTASLRQIKARVSDELRKLDIEVRASGPASTWCAFDVSEKA